MITKASISLWPPSSSIAAAPALPLHRSPPLRSPVPQLLLSPLFQQPKTAKGVEYAVEISLPLYRRVDIIVLSSDYPHRWSSVASARDQIPSSRPRSANPHPFFYAPIVDHLSPKGSASSSISPKIELRSPHRSPTSNTHGFPQPIAAPPPHATSDQLYRNHEQPPSLLVSDHQTPHHHPNICSFPHIHGDLPHSGELSLAQQLHRPVPLNPSTN